MRTLDVTVANGTVPNSKAIPFFGTATYYWQAAYRAMPRTVPPSAPALKRPSWSTRRRPRRPSSPSRRDGLSVGTMTVEGATGTPVRVATPPVTSTDGSSPSGDSMPLFALLICLSFGGLGLLAVQASARASASRPNRGRRARPHRVDSIDGPSSRPVDPYV